MWRGNFKKEEGVKIILWNTKKDEKVLSNLREVLSKATGERLKFEGERSGGQKFGGRKITKKFRSQGSRCERLAGCFILR